MCSYNKLLEYVSMVNNINLKRLTYMSLTKKSTSLKIFSRFCQKFIDDKKIISK